MDGPMVRRRRHTDLELLELAREGSAPAFASLLHRHREILRRGALRAAHPEQVVTSTMLSATRQLRRGAAPEDDIRAWLMDLMEAQVADDLGPPGVERILPSDWFDRTWVRAEQHWPSGRRRPRPPRWAGHAAGAVLLASAGAVGTYLTVTSEISTDVIRELVAEPVEDPDVIAVPGPIAEAPAEGAPELFGDVEIGELPTYDLTGQGGRERPDGPSLAPPRTDDRSAGDDADDLEPDEADVEDPAVE